MHKQSPNNIKSFLYIKSDLRYLSFVPKIEGVFIYLTCINKDLLGQQTEFPNLRGSGAEEKDLFLSCSSRKDSGPNGSPLQLSHPQVGHDVIDKHCIVLDSRV